MPLPNEMTSEIARLVGSGSVFDRVIGISWDVRESSSSSVRLLRFRLNPIQVTMDVTTLEPERGELVWGIGTA